MPGLTDALMGGFLFGDNRFLFLLGVLCTILPLPPISFSVLDNELGQKLGSLLVVLLPPQICLLKILYTSEYKLYWTIIFILIELCLMEMPFAFKFVDTSNSATIKYYCTNDSFLSVASPDSAATAPISSGC